MTKASEKIATFIKLQEAFVPKAYTPLAGDKLTYGYGFTTKPDGSLVTKDCVITEAEASAFLQKLLNDIAKKLIINPANRPQNEIDAVISLCYNIGTAKFLSSGTGQKFAKGEDISDRFIMWNQFQGKPNKGLSARRLKETRIYVEGNYDINLNQDEKQVLIDLGFKI